MLNEDREILQGREYDEAAAQICLTHSNVSTRRLDCWCPLTGEYVDGDGGWKFQLPITSIFVSPTAALKHGFFVPPEMAERVWRLLSQENLRGNGWLEEIEHEMNGVTVF